MQYLNASVLLHVVTDVRMSSKRYIFRVFIVVCRNIAMLFLLWCRLSYIVDSDISIDKYNEVYTIITLLITWVNLDKRFVLIECGQQLVELK